MLWERGAGDGIVTGTRVCSAVLPGNARSICMGHWYWVTVCAQAQIQAYFAAAPLYGQAQPEGSFGCLSWQRVLVSNRGCHLSPAAAAALTRAGSNSSSPGGPRWRGLSLAFALHSSTSRTVTRALKRGCFSQSALDRNRRRTNHPANASQVWIAQGGGLYQSRLEISANSSSSLKVWNGAVKKNNVFQLVLVCS